MGSEPGISVTLCEISEPSGVILVRFFGAILAGAFLDKTVGKMFVAKLLVSS